METNHTARSSLFGPEARELARWAIAYFAPRSLLSELGQRRRARFGEAFFWITVGAAAGAAAMYFGGPSGAAHRREVADWWRKTFPTAEDEESDARSAQGARRRDGGARTAVRDSVRRPAD